MSGKALALHSIKKKKNPLHLARVFGDDHFWSIAFSFFPVFSVWSVHVELSKGLTLVLTRLSMSSILGQTVTVRVFFFVFFFSEEPEGDKWASAPHSNSSRLEVIPLQAVGDFFQAWNGNSLMRGAFRGSARPLCVILTNGNVLGGVDVNLQTVTNTAAPIVMGAEPVTCLMMCFVKYCQCKMLFRLWLRDKQHVVGKVQ